MSFVDEAAFSEAFADVSRGNARVPLSAVSDTGLLPVVDQGKSTIAGYVDDRSLAVSATGPIIVFGDHTRAVKYVDFPFAMGADGTKLLKARPGFDPRYLYHALRSIDLSNAGYSRHFKFLKEARVPRFEFAEQCRIASILDEAEAIRTKRRAELAHFDQLPQALFQELFGGAFETVTLGSVATFVRGVTYKPVEVSEAGIGVMRTKNVQKYLDLDDIVRITPSMPIRNEKFLRDGDTLVSSANSWNLVGKCCFVDDLPERFAIGGFVTALRPTDRVNPRFLFEWFRSPTIQRTVRGFGNQTTNIVNLNIKRTEMLPLRLPPFALQDEYAEKVKAIHSEHDRVARALEADDELFAALQQRAFRGEL